MKKTTQSLSLGFLFFLSLFFLISCIGMDKSNEDSLYKKSQAKKTKKKEKIKWRQIKKQKGKSYSKKIKNLNTFILNNEDKEIALDAYLLKAKLYLKQKKIKEACSTYHQVVKSSIYYTKQWPAYKAFVQCSLRKGRVELSLKTIQSFLQNPKESLKNKKLAARWQWKILKNRKEWISWKLKNLSYLSVFSFQDKEKQRWKEEGKKIIDSLSEKDFLFQAHQAEKFSVFEAYLLYKAGKYFWNKKELSSSENFFKKSLASSLSINLKNEVKQKLNLMKYISKVNPYLIGVIVPLSGRRKALGEKILRGIHFGLEMGKDSPWQILVLDSKSHPDIVKTNLEELFYKYHVIGLIGGLTSETAEVIAKKAMEFFIPAVLFSQKKDLTLDRSFVFQNAITAEQLIRPLVEYSKEQLNVTKAALLYPNDSYGLNYTELFSEIFEENGGEIVGREAYKLGEVDFKNVIKNLLHLNLEGREEEFEELKEKYLKENPHLTERSRKLTPENLLPIKQEFEALFIPDSLKQIKKITDHLKYYGITKSYLFGTNLLTPRQNFSWPKEFPLIFINLPQKVKSSYEDNSFYKEYLTTFGQPPGLFEQRAYNSAVFLKKALNQGVQSRFAFYKELQNIQNFQGAYYPISISEEQIFKYPLNFYQIHFEKENTLDSVPVK